MSPVRRALTLILLALLGIAVTAAITWGTSQLVRQRIGLASQPLTAGTRLVPQKLPRSQSRPAPRSTPRTTPAATVPRTTTAAPAPSTAVEAPPAVSQLPGEEQTPSARGRAGRGGESSDSASRRDD